MNIIYLSIGLGHDGGTHRNVVPKYKNTLDAFRQIFREEGIRGMYKGIAVQCGASNVSHLLFFSM